MITSVRIKKKAAEELVQEVQKFPNVETGGVLCGSYHKSQLVITSVSGPGKNAIHGVDEFVMDKVSTDAFLDQAYACSFGMHIYLGEWHTHPQTRPQPSEQDLRSVFERTTEWQIGPIAFLIIGFLGFTSGKLEEQSFCFYYHLEDKVFYRAKLEFEA